VVNDKLIIFDTGTATYSIQNLIIFKGISSNPKLPLLAKLLTIIISSSGYVG